MKIIVIKMVFADFSLVFEADSLAVVTAEVCQWERTPNSHVLSVATVVTAVFRKRADLFGRTPFEGGAESGAPPTAPPPHIWLDQ